MPNVHSVPRASGRLALGFWIAAAVGFLAWVLLG